MKGAILLCMETSEFTNKFKRKPNCNWKAKINKNNNAKIKRQSQCHLQNKGLYIQLIQIYCWLYYLKFLMKLLKQFANYLNNILLITRTS